MQTKDLVVDEGGEGEVVEQIGEVLPNVCVTVLSEALVVEAVYLGDLAGLVVTTQDGDSLGIPNFECNKKGHGFNGVVATVNIVT